MRLRLGYLRPDQEASMVQLRLDRKVDNLGGSAHHQLGHVGHRHTPPAGDSQSQLGDGAGLVNNQANCAVLASAVEQGF